MNEYLFTEAAKKLMLDDKDDFLEYQNRNIRPIEAIASKYQTYSCNETPNFLHYKTDDFSNKKEYYAIFNYKAFMILLNRMLIEDDIPITNTTIRAFAYLMPYMYLLGIGENTRLFNISRGNITKEFSPYDEIVTASQVIRYLYKANTDNDKKAFVALCLEKTLELKHFPFWEQKSIYSKFLASFYEAEFDYEDGFVIVRARSKID